MSQVTQNPWVYPAGGRTSVKHDGQKSKVCSGMSKTFRFYKDAEVFPISKAKVGMFGEVEFRKMERDQIFADSAHMDNMESGH